jgi:hypothetical protein
MLPKVICLRIWVIWNCFLRFHLHRMLIPHFVLSPVKLRSHSVRMPVAVTWQPITSSPWFNCLVNIVFPLEFFKTVTCKSPSVIRTGILYNRTFKILSPIYGMQPKWQMKRKISADSETWHSPSPGMIVLYLYFPRIVNILQQSHNALES